MERDIVCGLYNSPAFFQKGWCTTMEHNLPLSCHSTQCYIGVAIEGCDRIRVSFPTSPPPPPKKKSSKLNACYDGSFQTSVQIQNINQYGRGVATRGRGCLFRFLGYFGGRWPYCRRFVPPLKFRGDALAIRTESVLVVALCAAGISWYLACPAGVPDPEAYHCVKWLLADGRSMFVVFQPASHTVSCV